jgi:ketosteroid isomerase-like protein
LIDTTSNLDIVTRFAIESAIHQLHATYSHRVDNGDFTGVAEVLQHSVLDVVGTIVSGRENIQKFYEAGLQLHPDGTPRTWHTVTNVMIDIDANGKKASSSSYYTVHQQLDGFPLQPICTGKYLDEFKQHEGQWRFTRRAVTLVLVGDLRHHVKGANEVAAGQNV